MASPDPTREPDEIWGAAVIGRIEIAADLFVKHLGSSENLLDIGCGVGRSSVYIAERLGATQLSGIDVSDGLVEEARTRGIDARVIDLDASPLPFADGSFDAVFCGEVIEHVRDTDLLLDEIARVLTPEGLCVLSTPNLAGWINRLALAFGWQPFFTTVSSRYLLGRPRWSSAGYGEGDIGHLHVFTTRSLLELIEAHGLRLVDVKPYSIGETMVPTERAIGGNLRHALLTLGERVDRLISRRKTLALGVIVAFQRDAGTRPKPWR